MEGLGLIILLVGVLLLLIALKVAKTIGKLALFIIIAFAVISFISGGVILA